MSKHYSTDSFELREGAFRFGGIISLQSLREAYYRDEIAHFLCRGLVEETMSKGFQIVGEDGEPVAWNDEAQEVIAEILPELITGLSYERRDGKSLLAFMKSGEKLIFRSFQRIRYEVEYDETGDIKSVEAQSDIEGLSDFITHTFENESELEDVMELIYRRREKVNEGMSFLEPIWDVLVAMYFLVSHSAYNMARNGAGVKKVTSKSDDITSDPIDDKALTTLIQDLANWGAAHDVLYVPPGVEVDMGETSGTINWLAFLDMYFRMLSAYTGVPKSTFEGMVPGQQQGAKVNEESYFDVLRDMQKVFIPVIMWFIKRLNDFYKWSTDGKKFSIDFNIREEMSEGDEITLMIKRMQLVSQLVKEGIESEKAFSMAGINIEPSDIEDDEDEDDDGESSEEKA